MGFEGVGLAASKSCYLERKIVDYLILRGVHDEKLKTPLNKEHQKGDCTVLFQNLMCFSLAKYSSLP